jgi:hypothetical protein
MRGRLVLVASLLLALAVPVVAADGDKPAAPPAAPPVKAPPAAPAAPTDKDKKDAAAKAAKEKEDKEKQAAAALLARPAPKDLDDALRRLARQRVNVQFKDTPFTEAVDHIRRLAGFNVIVSPVLQNKGVDGIRPLTLSLRDVTLKQVTDLVAQLSGTKLKYADAILQFTTREDARGKPVLRIYSIGDVTMPLRNFPGPDLNLRPSNSDFEDEPESEVPGAWSDPQKVVDMIPKLCGEETWTDADVSISADQNKLIVRQYPEVQREIARLIMLLRASR